MKTTVFLAGLVAAVAVHGAEFYVDAKAAAGGDGSSEKPFDAGFVDAANGNFALKPDAWLLKEMPQFKPIR